MRTATPSSGARPMAGMPRPLEFQLVRRTPEEALFNYLVAQYHPLGYARPVGEHLNYLVYATVRPIAYLAWSSPPRHLGPATASPPGRPKCVVISVFSPTILATSFCLGSAFHIWRRRCWVRWLAESRQTGSVSTVTRSIFWRPSSILNAIAVPVIGRPTGQ
jgi:hypothetical protein